MKIVATLEKLLAAAVMLAVVAAYSSAPFMEARADGETAGNRKYHVMPCIAWSLNENRSALHAFTFGDGAQNFRFDPIDIRGMEHLEFDLYLPDARVVRRWTNGETELEITSSGISDVAEYAWSGYALWEQAARNGLALADGWNHVRLDLPGDCAADLSRINYIRWYWNEAGAERRLEGCRVANLRFTARGGVDPANANLEPFIPVTVFPTEDRPVALADVTEAPYRADPRGEEDSTRAIQRALDDVSLNGGGTVWMPAGRYRITGPIRIPAYVTLRGDWKDPDVAGKYGTVIALDIPEEDRSDRGTFVLGGCGGVYGLTVYYPNQSPDHVRAYPFAFYVDDHATDSYLMPSVINCTVLNGYRGIGATTKPVSSWEEDGHENMYVVNFRGTFLECGAECYNESDFGFWDDVRISDKYWVEASRAGILPAVDESRLRWYTREHATGLILGDLDWASLNSISVEGCRIGLHTVQGRRPETNFQGLMYGVTTTDCDRGVVLDALHPDIGIVLANSEIEGGLYNNTTTVVRLFNVKVVGDKRGRLREDADFTLELPVPDSDYGYSRPGAILYTADLDISGRVDVSAQLQALLDRAGETGGVVYLPGGLYRLDAPLTVPAGVELKGTSAVPTKDIPDVFGYNGTTLLGYYTGEGLEDRALITLDGQGAGLSGLRINFPENRLQSHGKDRNMFNTAYAVRGAAPEVYIVNSFIAASAYGVDFTGCDRHCVGNLAACCYENLLKLGGEGGVVSNCFSNPYMFYVTATPFVQRPNGEEHKYYGDITQNHCRLVILEDAAGELIYNVAMCGAYITLINDDSDDTLVINLSSDVSNGFQTVMRGGSLTVVNAMRYGGQSIRHERGALRVYNRFEHGFSSGLQGDAVEESYVAWK